VRELTLGVQTAGGRRLNIALLVLRSFADLAYYEILTAIAGFPRIRDAVRKTQTRTGAGSIDSIREICDAVDIASCFYYKPVACMQRSFVAVRLLRKAGISADLVIGARPIPFLSHAWVEVHGQVVNDKKGYKRRLAEIERI
jgi:Transglutaminase-like superfamily